MFTMHPPPEPTLSSVRPTSPRLVMLGVMALMLGGACGRPPTGAPPKATVKAKTGLATTGSKAAKRQQAATKPAPTVATTEARQPVTAPKVPNSKSPIVVEVIHDTVCPWCRIGCHNLDTALARFTDRPVVVRYHPFLLDKDTPTDGRNLRAHLGKKYGAGRVDSMFKRVTAVGAKAGVRFVFGADSKISNSALSHALIAAAPPAKQRALLRAIHDAYFERGVDIGNAANLTKLGLGVGMNAAEVKAALNSPSARTTIEQQARSGIAASVRGVPHFVIDGRIRLGGAQSPEQLVTALKRAAATLSGTANPGS
ncbi:MAG: DsbA family oxidoreductase [Myxococcales bacterium]|nr:DsbA family oxidoreductase [Myxococcales bacterium]